MNIQSNFEEKRFALRLSLRLPIVVSGRTAEGETWSEPTETDNISTTGALFQLNQSVQSGDKLYIRSHRPDGIPVEVMAEVARISTSQHGTARIGIAICEATDGWIRFFVAWVADDQPSELENIIDEVSGEAVADSQQSAVNIVTHSF